MDFSSSSFSDTSHDSVSLSSSLSSPHSDEIIIQVSNKIPDSAPNKRTIRTLIFSYFGICVLFGVFFLAVVFSLVVILVFLQRQPSNNLLNHEVTLLKQYYRDFESQESTMSFIYASHDDFNNYEEFPYVFTDQGGSGFVVPLSQEGSIFRIEGKCSCCFGCENDEDCGDGGSCDLVTNECILNRRGTEVTGAVCILEAALVLFTIATSYFAVQSTSERILQSQCLKACREENEDKILKSTEELVDSIEKEQDAPTEGRWECTGQCINAPWTRNVKNMIVKRKAWKCSGRMTMNRVIAKDAGTAERSFLTILTPFCLDMFSWEPTEPKEKEFLCSPDASSIECALLPTDYKKYWVTPSG